MTYENLQDLYVAELQEARSAKALLADGLPELAGASSDRALRQALMEHRGKAVEHEARLSAIIERMGASPQRHTDGSMRQLLDEARKMCGLSAEGALRDASIIAAAQRLEHYDIAVFGTLMAYARTLGRHDDAVLLGAMLEEEKDADTYLTDIAVGMTNPTALELSARQL